MKKLIYSISILLILLLSCFPVYGISKNDYKEKEVQLKEEYINFKSNMQDEWIKEKNELYKLKLDNNNMWVKVIVIVSSIGTVFAILEKSKIEDKIKDEVKTRMKDHVENRINSEIEKNVEHLLRKSLNKKQEDIEKYVEEIVNRITIKEKLKNKKILIIYKKNKNNDLESLLKQFNVKFEEFSGIKEMETFDIIIFESMDKEENSNEKISAEDMRGIMDKNNNDLAVYLWYGKGNIDRNIINDNNINFSNSPITLYSNLVSALEFQEMLLENN